MKKFYLVLFLVLSINCNANDLKEKCPRITDIKNSNKINEIFDCIENKIILSRDNEDNNNSSSKDNKVVSGIFVEAKSAKLVNNNGKTYIATTISLTNKTSNDVPVAFTGPTAIAHDDNDVTFEVKNNYSVKGIAMCVNGGYFTHTSLDTCERLIQVRDYTVLLPNIPVNFTLDFTPQFDDKNEISSNIISISLNLFVHKDNKTKRVPFSLEEIQVK